jgi:methionine aminotransferase
MRPRSSARAACRRSGTTIFTVMSALAAQCNAINLGQGFPDFDCDPAPRRRRGRGDEGRPQPVPADGLACPRCARRWPTRSPRLGGRAYDPDTEITITAGATQGILSAVLALVHRATR